MTPIPSPSLTKGPENPRMPQQPKDMTPQGKYCTPPIRHRRQPEASSPAQIVSRCDSPDMFDSDSDDALGLAENDKNFLNTISQENL